MTPSTPTPHSDAKAQVEAHIDAMRSSVDTWKYVLALLPLVMAAVDAANALSTPGADKIAAGRTIAQAVSDGINAVKPGTISTVDAMAAFDAAIQVIAHADKIVVKHPTA